jgi:hypothetical protein
VWRHATGPRERVVRDGTTQHALEGPGLHGDGGQGDSFVR